MPRNTGYSGTADFWIDEKSEADVRKEALERTRWLQQEERHVEAVISSLHKITQGKKPKDIPLAIIRQTAKSVLLELKKLEGAFGELKYKKGSESSVKAFDEFIAYFRYWQFLYKEGRLPGLFQYKMMKFNVKTVEHVLEDVAKLLGKSVDELKIVLRDAHKRFSSSNIEYIKR